MRWEDERWVKVYTRDTGEWLALGWEAQAVFLFALRKADRAGILKTGKMRARGLAGMTGIPLEVVERSLPLLLEDGCLRETDGGYIIPNFLAAQEARRGRIRVRPELRDWYDENPGTPPPEGVELDVDVPVVRLLTPEEQAARRAEHEEQARIYRAEAEERRRLKARRWVYFMQERGNVTAPIKIGISRDVERRRGELQRAEGIILSVLATMEGTVKDEQAFHQRFSSHRLHGEWFSPAPEIFAQVAVLNGVKE
jgi:hypothetical protein